MKNAPSQPAASGQPTLTTERLVLRPFRADDAPAVRRLAGAWEIADTTLTIPHPYGEGVAERWIESHAVAYGGGTDAVFAVTTGVDGVVGAIGLRIHREHRRAEMGYWIGTPFWGRGYCTEAARALLAFAFGELELERVYAHHFSRNPGSGRVMQKLGMRHEGTLRRHVLKWDRPEDLELFGILREEFEG